MINYDPKYPFKKIMICHEFFTTWAKSQQEEEEEEEENNFQTLRTAAFASRSKIMKEDSTIIEFE